MRTVFALNWIKILSLRRNRPIGSLGRCELCKLAGQNQAVPKKFFSSKRIFEPKPAPKRHKEKAKIPEIQVWIGMTFRELANSMNKPHKFIVACTNHTDFADNYVDDPEETLEDTEHIAKIARLAGFKVKVVPKPKNAVDQMFEAMKLEEEMDVKPQPPPDPSKTKHRWPVVTIMGHVDHGKTTLLDFLRKSEIVKSEFGGITQHIGAFLVKLPNSDDKITFLDTPGHAAFKSMRARGARVTDIVILVVAADDGVMEQTVESIKFAQQADVPIIVAINKCDKSGVDIERVKHQLMTYNLIPEQYGGDVQVVEISALKGTGVETLKDAVMTQAEVMQLRTDFGGLVEGAVIEARTIHGKGKTASVLIHRGTLTKGRYLVAGYTYCCVRAMYDEFGRQVDEAPPSTPVEVTGWREQLPSAGDSVLEVANEKRANTVVSYRKSKQMEKQASEEKIIIEELRAKEREAYSQLRHQNIEAEIKNLRIRKKKKQLPIKQWRDEVKNVEHYANADSDIPEFNIILKGDVDGSVEAILEVINTYASEKCKFNVIHSTVGPVTENDVELAETFNASIYTFNVSTTPSVLAALKTKNIPLKPFNIIYRMVDDFKRELSNRLPTVDREETVGEGVVLQHFQITAKGAALKKVPVAGCRCVKGQLVRKCRVKFLRGDQLLYDGEIESMHKGADPVSAGHVEDEVGLLVKDPPKDLKFQPDDHVICYKIVQDPQAIDWHPPGF